MNAVRKFWFPVAIGTLILFKLWLVHTEEIFGRTGEYDNLWYLKSAENWYWGAPYSWTAFFRPPTYPLFIAVVHAFGIPLRIAIELLQLGGFLAIVGAFRVLRVPRAICLSIFALCALHPCGFQLNNLSISDTFYAAILSYLIGGLIVALCKPSWSIPLLAGVCFAILWTTREESFLLVLIFATFASLALGIEWRESNSWVAAFRNRVWSLGTNLLTATILIMSILIANYCAFGSFAKSEMMSRSFRAAHRALVRIKPADTHRYILVTRQARELAYSVSPTFAHLKEDFENGAGRKWQSEARELYGLNGEIDGGHFRFALSNVAAAAGMYRDPVSTHHFFQQIADEINLACDQRRIPSRFVFSTFLDPDLRDALPNLPHSLAKVFSVFAQQYRMSPDREDSVLRPPNRAVYDAMANRRESFTRIGTLRLVGWAFQFGDPLQFVGYDSGGGEIEQGMADHFSTRPDVVEEFKTRGETPANMEFALPIELRRGRVPAGGLMFVTRSGRVFSGPTSSIVDGNAPMNPIDGSSLEFRLLAQEFQASDSSCSILVENWIGKYFRHVIRLLILMSVIALVVLAMRYRSLALDAVNAALILLAVVIGSRVLLIAYLDATAFPGDDPRFLFPVMSIYSCFLVLLIYQAAAAWRAKR